MTTATDDHAGLMDKVYRRQRFFYDLTRKYYLFGRDRLIRSLKLAPGDRLVEVGCGTARNLVKIARRYPGAELFGLDASSEMLKTARRTLARAGLAACAMDLSRRREPCLACTRPLLDLWRLSRLRARASQLIHDDGDG